MILSELNLFCACRVLSMVPDHSRGLSNSDSYFHCIINLVSNIIGRGADSETECQS